MKKASNKAIDETLNIGFNANRRKERAERRESGGKEK
jgi:hypothetical protein